jgi:hypothetical protein
MGQEHTDIKKADEAVDSRPDLEVKHLCSSRRTEIILGGQRDREMSHLDTIMTLNVIVAAALELRQAEANFIDILRNFSIESLEAKAGRRIVMTAQAKIDELLEQSLPGVCAMCLKGKEPVFYQDKWQHKIDGDNYEPCKGAGSFRQACRQTTSDHIDNMFDGLREDLDNGKK